MVAVMVAVMVAAAVVLTGIWSLAHYVAPAQPAIAGHTLAEVLASERPARFAGHEISVEGRVEGWVGAAAFTLVQGDGLRDVDVLVIGRRAPHHRPHGDVRVSGTLEILGETGCAGRLAGDFPDLAPWLGRPVIVAEVVHRIDR